MSFFKTLEQFVRPKAYADGVLQGHKFAWGKTGALGLQDRADNAYASARNEVQDQSSSQLCIER